MTTSTPTFSDSDQDDADLLMFTADELIKLGKTADALSAYLGAVVLAEVGESEGGEWVIFGQALATDEESSPDQLTVQLGGKQARLLGGQGGIDAQEQAYDCTYLWSIQITDDPDERFVKLDASGEIIDQSATLDALLPFSLVEPDFADESEEEEEEEEEENAADQDDDNPDLSSTHRGLLGSRRLH